MLLVPLSYDQCTYLKFELHGGLKTHAWAFLPLLRPIESFVVVVVVVAGHSSVIPIRSCPMPPEIHVDPYQKRAAVLCEEHFDRSRLETFRSAVVQAAVCCRDFEDSERQYALDMGDSVATWMATWMAILGWM